MSKWVLFPALCLVIASQYAVSAELRSLRPEIPFMFEENRGQSPREFRYVLTHYNSGFSCQGLYSRYSGIPHRDFAGIGFAGANASCSAELIEPTSSFSHFYRGQRKSASVENLQHFRQLLFHNVWPGVEIRYTASVSEFTGYVANITARSAADLARIRLSYGASGLIVDSGRLLTDIGSVLVGGPVVVTQNQFDRVFTFSPRPGAGAGPITFTLTVPMLTLSVPMTRFTVDADRNIYAVAGTTTYPELDPSAETCIQESITNACPDAYVAKFNQSGALQYLVYLQGTRYDAAYQVEVDRGGNVYVAGATLSGDFVTTQGVYRESYAGPQSPVVEARAYVGGDAFLAKLHGPTGGLIYSTLIGNSGAEAPYAMRVDDYGNSYLLILSRSPDFPLKGSPVEEAPACETTQFQTPGSPPACRFLLLLDENGRELVYSLKTSARDFGISSWGAAYYIGSVSGSELPQESFVQSLWPDGTARYRVSLGNAMEPLALSPAIGDRLSVTRGMPESTGAELLLLGPTGETLTASRVPARVNVQRFGLQNDESGATWILASPETRTPDAPYGQCPTCPGVIAFDVAGNVAFATHLPIAPYVFRVTGGLVYFAEVFPDTAIRPTLTILDRGINFLRNASFLKPHSIYGITKQSRRGKGPRENPCRQAPGVEFLSQPAEAGDLRDCPVMASADKMAYTKK